MRNDHFLRQIRDDRLPPTSLIRRADQITRQRPTALDWLLLAACGLVLGCGIAALLSLIMPGFIP